MSLPGPTSSHLGSRPGPDSYDRAWLHPASPQACPRAGTPADRAHTHYKECTRIHCTSCYHSLPGFEAEMSLCLCSAFHPTQRPGEFFCIILINLLLSL